MSASLILICGVSGVGKSTLIDHLVSTNPNIFRLPIYTSRTKRTQNDHKISITSEEITHLTTDPQNIVMNIYDSIYLIKHEDISKSLRNGLIPITDWPFSQIHLFNNFNLKTIYLLPPSEKELENRLKKRGESEESIKNRTITDQIELVKMKSGKNSLNYHVIINNKIEDTVVEITKLLI